MRDTDLSQELMARLVQSEPWRAYLRYLLDHFAQLEELYDRASENHVRLQASKAAIRQCIETPYQVAGLQSPLARPQLDHVQAAKRKRRTRARTAAPVPLVAARRASGLV
jgi:hypothetical protein